MADVTLTYKGTTIAELSDSGSKAIRTAGKYCEADIGVEYVKPSGGGWSADDIASGAAPNGALRLTDISIREYALSYRSGITGIHISNSTRKDIGISAMAYCTGLTVLVAHLINQMRTSAVQRCNALTIVDLDASKLENYALQQANNLSTLILRNTSITTLSGIQTFISTPFASGGAGGTIYVPSALISAYQAATNWSTVNGYGTITWAAIEGSIYETQYADGTPIPTE